MAIGAMNGRGKMSKKLYVGNLPYGLTEEDLKRALEKSVSVLQPTLLGIGIPVTREDLVLWKWPVKKRPRRP